MDGVIEMKKHKRISEFVRQMNFQGDSSWEPRYVGFFVCFNRGAYYEAHDVLEDLWLEARDERSTFYKGLIQLAGGFVHLKKQYFRPMHHKDGRRLAPAARLLRLAETNLSAYPPQFLGISLPEIEALIGAVHTNLTVSNFTRNPWRPERAPQLTPPDPAAQIGKE